MERRTFLGGVAGLATFSAAARAASPAEEAEIRQRIADWYRAFTGHDRDRYRSFLTDDYQLLEHGELLDVAGDMAMHDRVRPDHVRTDSFDHRFLRIDGDTAYAVYFLTSHMRETQRGEWSRRYLESVLLRRSGGQWRAALLHSTRIEG